MARIEAIFLATSELPPSKWAQHLDTVCGDDVALRRDVEALLDADGRANVVLGNFARKLGVPANPKLSTEPPAHSAGMQPVEEAGTIAGPYRLLREIGHGGMGTVWLAQRADGLIERPVALKLPHRTLGEWFDGRFDREREILAALSHANIARLYDAGVTADGQPFLALEYIEGKHIDAYCVQFDLGVRETIALFRQVTNAVAHAHAQLVVHRDLKPSNILVDEHGNVSLLDFGIAKLLAVGSDKNATIAGVAPLTPRYAAPEQIAGEPITIAADLYSLGVLLFELLTGALPYHLQPVGGDPIHDQVLRAVPPKPSEVVDDPKRSRALRGDLDTIVLKLLSKQPAQRYATVNALDDDLSRYLRGDVVLAQAESVWYRGRKFFMRHRLPFAAGGAVLSAILIGAGVALWQARVARAEALVAQRTSDFLLSTFSSVEPAVARGKEITAKELLAQAVSSLDSAFVDAPELKARMLTHIGKANTQLGHYPDAEQQLREALAINESRLGLTHPETLVSLVQLGHTLSLQNKMDDAQRTWQEVAARAPRDSNEKLRAGYHLAINELRQDKIAQGTERLEGNTAAWHAAFGLRHERTLAALSALGTGYKLMGRLAEAEAVYVEIAEPFESLFGSDHPHNIGQLSNLADLYVSMHRETDARPLYLRALKLSRRVNGDGHPNTARIGMNLANLWRTTGDLDAAEALYVEMLAHREQLVGPNHPETISHLSFLGSLRLEQGRLGAAEAIQRQALARAEQAMDSEHRYAVQPLRGLLDVLETRLAKNAANVDMAELEALTERWLDRLGEEALSPNATEQQVYEYARALVTCKIARYCDFELASGLVAKLPVDETWQPYVRLVSALSAEHRGDKMAAHTQVESALKILPEQPSAIRRELVAVRGRLGKS